MNGIHIEGDVSGQVGQGGTVIQTSGGPPRPATAPIVILFWASNPIDSSRLRLDEEVRTIDERLRSSEFRDLFDLETQWAVRIGDLSEGLLRYRPTIVHFSGHGNPTGEVLLERADGTAGPVSPSALAGLFAAVSADEHRPRVVVFNACFSEATAEAVAPHVDCVVGTTAAIGDQAAISFAGGFYRALGYGESMRSAFELGRNEIDLASLDQENVPRLLSRVDPSTIALIEGPGAAADGRRVGAPAADQGERRQHQRQQLQRQQLQRSRGEAAAPELPESAAPPDLGEDRDMAGSEPEEAPEGVADRGETETASNGGGEADQADETWNLETRFPRRVEAGSVTSLIVEITREADTGPDVAVLPDVHVAEGTEVGVVVQAKRGFEVEGRSEGKLMASTDSLPIRFQLKATGTGSGHIRVLFFVEATALGAVTLKPAIVAPEAHPDEAPVPASAVVSALSVGTGRPDLELLVLEDSSTGPPKYSVRVTAADEALGIHLTEFGPIELHTDARSYFTEMFHDNEALDLSTPDDRARAQRLLESKGNHLFQSLFPAQLQTLLWRIRDRIVRIRIDSEEPYIPWELVRLSGPDETGTIVEGKFLCEYETTRWIPGYGLHSHLTLADFGVVIPDDSGLASAQEEKDFLQGLAGDGRHVTAVPATFTGLMDAFATGTYDVWHFSGHGAVKDQQDPNRSAMQLSDGQKFTPEQISGAQANLGKAHPLVFLNACQIGRAGMSLTGLGGWASQFLEVGAAGFIGAMWNVHDNPARDFAQAFYNGLLGGETIGTATLKARNQIKQYQDATWLAYTVYGHPSAALAEQGG